MPIIRAAYEYINCTFTRIRTRGCTEVYYVTLNNGQRVKMISFRPLWKPM